MNGEFRAIAEEECARLRPLLARHEEEERDNRDDLPRRVSFDDSAEGERVHRYQARWSHTLLRTLAELRNHRGLPEPEARPEPATGAVPPSPSVEPPAPQLDVAVPSSSASTPEPVPVIPPPAEDPAVPPPAEAMVRNKPTVDEPTSEPTRSCDESAGQGEPNSTATAAGCGQKSCQEPFFQLRVASRDPGPAPSGQRQASDAYGGASKPRNP